VQAMRQKNPAGVMTSTSAKLAGLLLAWYLAMPGIAAAPDDFAGIHATVFDYLEGINQLDRDRLERAFDGNAALKSVNDEGALVIEPIASAIERWLRGAAGERSGKILSIEVADNQIARVVFDFDGAFLDYLTLAKLDEQWRIIDKVFLRR
jgi:hypothetical protein